MGLLTGQSDTVVVRKFDRDALEKLITSDLDLIGQDVRVDFEIADISNDSNITIYSLTGCTVTHRVRNPV